jgi:hypothetical protein
MNEKLKRTFHTIWTEPRHFFFWLALLGFGGVVAVEARGVAARDSTVFQAFFALGCGVCFCLGSMAFVLAWLPPVRRWLSRLLGQRFLVAGCIVTIVALFYAVEDWRGRGAWQHFKRAQEAQGERFDLASLGPAPVPAEQNFFEAPLWDFLRFTRMDNRTVWKDTNWGSHILFDIYGPGPSDRAAPGTGNWQKAQRVDLAAWQAFYRGTNNLHGPKHGPFTNYFPIAAQPQSPAADVLLALSKFDANRQLLTAAAERPQARFWMNYEAGAAIAVPHLAKMKASVQYLALHAEAALKAGDTDTALQDLKLLFRLNEAIRNEPILISQLVRVAQSTISLQPVWEGLADHRWRPADLTYLEGELAKLDFLADCRVAMDGERGCNLWMLDYLRKNGLAGLDPFGDSRDEGAALGFALFRLIPSGWFDQNSLSVCRVYEDVIRPVVDMPRRVISPSRANQSTVAFETMRLGPYNVFAKKLMPAHLKAVERFARAQAAVDEARLACALERYRLANGQFPETLESLAPKYIDALPSDVINGQPFKYRRTDDGQFILYSVGWNETDDGGKVVLTKTGTADADKGDWVWRYPERAS